MSNPLNDQTPIPLPDTPSYPPSAAAPAAAVFGRAAGSATKPASLLRLAPPLGACAMPPAPASADAAMPTRQLASAIGPLLLRTLQPADALAHAAFLYALGEEGRRMRRFALPRSLPHTLSHILPHTLLRTSSRASGSGGAVLLTMVLAAPAGSGGPRGLLAELSVCIDRGCVAAEFALVVRPELQGRGLGRILMGCLLDASRARRVALVCGSVPAGGQAMLALARASGFQVLPAADGSAQLALMLRPRGVR